MTARATRVAVAAATVVAVLTTSAAIARASARLEESDVAETPTETQGQTYTATGSIIASNPISPFAGGITENDFILEECGWPPIAQGLDGYAFQVPDAFAQGTATATVTGSNALGFYDLNLAFFTDCAILGTSTSPNPDETAGVPGATHFIMVNAARGIDTLISLTLTTASGPAPTPDPTPSPTQSATPTPTPSQSATPTPTPSQSATPTPTPTPSQSATPTPSPTQSGTPSPAPSQSATPTPTPTPTESETPAESQSPTPDPAPTATPRGEATTTIATDRHTVRLGAPFTLSGSVSADEGCGSPPAVEISKRLHGTTSYAPIGTAPVRADGSWQLEVTSRRNASYLARPQNTQTCDGLTSQPVDGFVRVDVTVSVPRSCTAPQRVTGTVSPKQPGTHVLLQRRVRGNWVTQDIRFLHRSSRFHLRPASCRGSFRVVWPTQDERNVRGARRFRF